MKAVLRLVGALLVACFGFLPAGIAHASTDDTFDRFDVQARLDTDGYLTITETVVLRFGDNSGRHGLERVLTTREPDGADNDMLFKIDQVTVSSPSGAPSGLDLTEVTVDQRNSYLRIRVGDPNQTVSAPTATYVLTYRVLGLVRSPGGVDQLYWDVSGSGMPLIVAATTVVEVPGGAQEVTCSAAVPGSRGECVKSKVDGKGRADFAAGPIPRGHVLTVGVRLSPGLVKNNTPILEPNAERAWDEGIATAAEVSLNVFGVALVGAVIAPLVGWWRVRRATADYRFAGLPPGVLPAAGQDGVEQRSPRDLQIPVAFSPPPASVAEAGYLLDGKVDVRDVTATLVGLAVSGAIRLGTEGGRTRANLVEWDKASDRTSKTLLKRLFPDRKARREPLDLSGYGVLAGTPAAIEEVVMEAATAGGWYRRAPSAVAGLMGCDVIIKAFLGIIFVVVGAVIATVFFGVIGVIIVMAALGTLPLLISVGITWMVVRKKQAVGQRSAVGRALTDQVEGFRTYLATAEADQLRFEEGEDIFSKYLPWAIAFNLTHRWTQVCQQLIQAGRLSPAAPSWFDGTTWDTYQFTQQMERVSSASNESFSSSVPTSSSDSGFGSSSSAFDGGGSFSGGGGGGGGGGSW